MTEETVSLVGSAPVRTPNDKEYVEKVRQDIAYRSGFIPAIVPTVLTAKDPIAAVVMDPKNPHLSLYRELRAGIISFAEFQEALDCQVCQPHVLDGFKYHRKPEKPQALMDAEHEITMQTVRMSEVKKYEVMRDFNASARDRFKKYYKDQDRIDELNRSNLHTIQDILSRQKDKNQVFAARLQAVIDTH